MTIGNRLKDLRLKRDLNQDEVAEKLGITRGSYAKYENNITKPPGNKLKLLADFYNVSTDYLLTGEDKTDVDLGTILKGRPHFNGIPIEPDQADFFIDLLQTYIERRKKELNSSDDR